MAGSSMTFTEITHSTVKKIKCAWTSDDTTGAVSGTTTYPYSGRLLGAITVPGTGGDAPDPNYDIAVNDSDGVDVALGALQNRHTSNTEFVAEASMAGIAHSKITVAVTAAGNSNKGTLYLFIR
jgi:hypothetical protein